MTRQHLSGSILCLLRNNDGSAIIMMTAILVAILAFAFLAIEGAVLMTTRTQLQSAADAAALAGATALVSGDQVEATTRAINFASYNTATQTTSSAVIITGADVSFPQDNIIRVQTHRTRATGDAMRTYFLQVIDPASDGLAEMTAVAAASVLDLCGARCVKPWSIPDRFTDVDADGVFSPGDIYDPITTGYRAPADIGLSIVLKSGNPQQAIQPGIFYPVDYPPLNKYPGQDPLTGGDWYREWISECTPYVIEPGDELQLEPGNMVGPTMQGIDELISQDPNAQWDAASQKIVNSAFGQSPRIALVPFFDPRLPPTNGRNSVTISKLAAFFIESTGPGSQVNGRFVEVTSAGIPCPAPEPGTFIKGIVLVE